MKRNSFFFLEAPGRPRGGPRRRALKLLKAQKAPPPPLLPSQRKKEALNPHQVAKVDRILPPERQLDPKVKKRPPKIARVFHHHEERKEVTTAQPVERSQTESVRTQPQSSVQSAAAVAPVTGKGGGGAAGGAGGHAGTGNMNGPGGSGPSEIAFGSPNGPRFLHQEAPAYPALARRLEKQGIVLLRVTIDPSGRPVKVEVLRKAGFGMDEEAVKAVEESTFVPARKGGRPLTCRALLPIKFVLETS